MTAAYRNKSLQHRPDRTGDRAAPEEGTHETSTMQRINAAYDATNDWYESRECAVGARRDLQPRSQGAAGVSVTAGVFRLDDVAVASGGVFVGAALSSSPPHATSAMNAIPTMQIVVSLFKANASC